MRWKRGTMAVFIIAAAGFVSGASAAPKIVIINGLVTPSPPHWVAVGGTGGGNATVAPGDTIVWVSKDGPHGTMFKNWDEAQKSLEVAMIGQQPAFPPPAQGTTVFDKTNPVIVKMTVKAGAVSGTQIPYFCTQHGTGMAGVLKIQ